MTLDSLPDLDTSGLCLVKTLSTALTCWPSRNGTRRSGTTAEHPRALRRSPKGRPRYHCRPAPPRQTDALSSRTSRSRPLETSQPSDVRAKTSVLRACRVPNPANRLNVVQRPKTLVEPSHWSQPPAGGVGVVRPLTDSETASAGGQRRRDGQEELVGLLERGAVAVGDPPDSL